MTPEACNAFCAALPATTHVVQWGGADVWKVGGKVFAIVGWGDDNHLSVSLKVTPLVYEIYRDHPDCRPAPYLASRGMTWIQYYRGDTLTEDDLKGLIADSHKLVSAGLPKKTRKELGLI
ncbi:MAG: MmcQ/YjbR family DNA-binding protein [Asticcacaulis sp.]